MQHTTEWIRSRGKADESQSKIKGGKTMAQQSTIGKVATTVHTNEQGQTQVTYHSTPVVSFTNKLIVLNHGGWMTNTTKTRMNQASVQFSLGYHVYQDKFDWWVVYRGEHIPFEENTLTLTR